MSVKKINPEREYAKDRDRVCEDSAVEVFFAFPEKDQQISNDVMYINYEMNATVHSIASLEKDAKDGSLFQKKYAKESLSDSSGRR